MKAIQLKTFHFVISFSSNLGTATDIMPLFLSKSIPDIFVRSAVFLNFSLALLSSFSDFMLEDCNDGIFECHYCRLICSFFEIT